MKKIGKFFGIGVGPGPAKFIPLAAWEVLQQADLIFFPRARHVKTSIALKCLTGLDLPLERFRQIVYNMETDTGQIDEHYDKIAREIVGELNYGQIVAYLTIGDSLTYSTYSYLLAALLKIMPDLTHTTFPGITSYAALAATFDWPLGQGKERTLILPCPTDMDKLRSDIDSHDVVVLMKIGHRLPAVLTLLHEMGIMENCVFASRLGLPGEALYSNLAKCKVQETLGYLSTMLIRRHALKRRQQEDCSVLDVTAVPSEEIGASVL